MSIPIDSVTPPLGIYSRRNRDACHCIITYNNNNNNKRANIRKMVDLVVCKLHEKRSVDQLLKITFSKKVVTYANCDIMLDRKSTLGA